MIFQKNLGFVFCFGENIQLENTGLGRGKCGPRVLLLLFLCGCHLSSVLGLCPLSLSSSPSPLSFLLVPSFFSLLFFCFLLLIFLPPACLGWPPHNPSIKGATNKPRNLSLNNTPPPRPSEIQQNTFKNGIVFDQNSGPINECILVGVEIVEQDDRID